jgi:uncharacterized membrane protein
MHILRVGLLSFAASFMTVLAACSSGGDSLGSASCPTGGTKLTYESFGQPFVEKYCAGCHSGSKPKDGLDLSTIESIRTHAGAMYEQAAASSAMPPEGTAPTDDERKQLGEWLGCDAP